MSILQFPQLQNPDRRYATSQRHTTSGVHPQPTSDTLAIFRNEIAAGLTPEKQYLAVREAVMLHLSTAAIEGASTPSLESKFALGLQDVIDPNLWDKVKGEVQGDTELTATPLASVEQADSITLEALRRQQIREYISRSGPNIVKLREERLNDAA